MQVIRTIAIIGAGTQARFHMHAFQDVFRWRTTIVWSRTAERAQDLCTELRRSISCEFIAADTVQAAVRGADVVITAAGTGLNFIGELPASTMIGMKLILTDLYEERGDTVIGRSTNSLPMTLPRAATHWFAMDSARHF